MGIQAFEPMLVEGNAIQLHPLVCKGFNADFDGDQMAVHLPLSIEAQVEAHTLMMSTNNIFSPANGKPIISPSQDIVMGCYYITMALPGRRGEGMVFSSLDEAELAYSQGVIDLHALIKVRLPGSRHVKVDEERASVPGAIVATTVGRIMFNAMLPQGMPYYNYPMRSGELAGVISDCYQILGRKATIDLAGRHEQARLPREHPQRAFVRHRRPDDAADQGQDHRRRGEDRAQEQEAVPARHHHRGGAIQPGSGRLDPRPREHHRGDDDGAGDATIVVVRATSTRSFSWPIPAPAAASSRFASWPACAA